MYVLDTAMLQAPPALSDDRAGWRCPRRLMAGSTAGSCSREADARGTGTTVFRAGRPPQLAVMAGLARGDDAYDLMVASASCHVPGQFSPDRALIELAVTALDLVLLPAPSRWSTSGCGRDLPEVTFRGRVEHHHSQYALYAAARMRGGLQPDLLGVAGWWETPLWQYAVVVYTLVAGERLTAPVEEIARRVAARHGLQLAA
jgi:hypothetical protein